MFLTSIQPITGGSEMKYLTVDKYPLFLEVMLHSIPFVSMESEVHVSSLDTGRNGNVGIITLEEPVINFRWEDLH